MILTENSLQTTKVVGSEVGKCLKEELQNNGWNTIKRITLCNDTVAALLAGAACATEGDRFSSYIGYILGTGMNAAYIQPECDVCKIKEQMYSLEDQNVNFRIMAGIAF